MYFLVLSEQTVFFRQKQRQLIFIDSCLFIKEILPDKAAFLPVFRDGGISDHIPVFIQCVHIKDKYSPGIQIIVHQPEHLQQLFLLKDVIHGIADADHCLHGTVQFKFPHILQQVKDIVAGSRLFFHGSLQHFFGVVHADHVVALPGQQFRHGAGAAAQFQYKAVCHLIFPEKSGQIPAPGRIINIIHKQVIDPGKIFIGFFHSVFSLLLLMNGHGLSLRFPLYGHKSFRIIGRIAFEVSFWVFIDMPLSKMGMKHSMSGPLPCEQAGPKDCINFNTPGDEPQCKDKRKGRISGCRSAFRASLSQEHAHMLLFPRHDIRRSRDLAVNTA